MWRLICDIFEKHTLLNKLAARRRFYTAKMHDNEKILPFAARIRQMAATLKSMSINIEDSEMAMALLNGLRDRFDSLISALDASHTDDKQLTFELVQSRCLQEEQRHTQRDQDALKKSEAAALLATKFSKSRKFPNAETCIHCGKHRDSSRCYTKFPHLAPKGHPARAHLDQDTKKDTKALLAQQSANLQLPLENESVCLLGNPPVTSTALQSSSHPTSSSGHWIIDSGCTSHVTHNRSAFVSYTAVTTLSTLDLGANSSAPIRQSFAILTRTSNGWMYVNVFIVVYVQEMDAQSRIRSCTGCARRKFQNFAIFGAKHPLAPMAFKHFTPNFERARTFTFVYVHILDVRGCAPPATPTFGCARRNGKRPTLSVAVMSD